MDEIERDLAALEPPMARLTGLADDFGRTLTAGLRAAVVEGRALDDVLRQMLLRLSDRALGAALAPLGDLLARLAGSAASALVGGLLPGLGAASASAASAASARAAGPGNSEAGPQPQGARPGLTVVFNVTARDAESFRRSEAQVTSMLARAVGRGRRGL